MSCTDSTECLEARREVKALRREMDEGFAQLRVSVAHQQEELLRIRRATSVLLERSLFDLMRYTPLHLKVEIPHDLRVAIVGIHDPDCATGRWAMYARQRAPDGCSCSIWRQG